MSRAVAGLFPTLKTAQAAAEALRASGLIEGDVAFTANEGGSPISVADQQLVNQLQSTGFSKSEAGQLAEGVRRGCALLTATALEGKEAEASTFLREQGAADLPRWVEQWKSGGWTSFDPTAKTLDTAGFEYLWRQSSTLGTLIGAPIGIVICGLIGLMGGSILGLTCAALGIFVGGFFGAIVDISTVLWKQNRALKPAKPRKSNKLKTA